MCNRWLRKDIRYSVRRFRKRGVCVFGLQTDAKVLRWHQGIRHNRQIPTFWV